MRISIVTKGLCNTHGGIDKMKEHRHDYAVYAN